MRKIVFSIILFALLALPYSAFASGFHLKTIGELNVEGGMYSHIYYTSTNVTFTGIAPTNQTVNIDVNGVVGTTSTSSSSDWEYSTTLNEGDNAITMTTEGSDPLVFTLTVGEVPEGVGGIPEADTPVAGVSYPTVLMIVLGAASLFSVPYLLKNSL